MDFYERDGALFRTERGAPVEVWNGGDAEWNRYRGDVADLTLSWSPLDLVEAETLIEDLHGDPDDLHV